MPAETEKNSKPPSKKTIDTIDDKENGVVGSSETPSFDSPDNNSHSCAKKRKNKVKTIREELEHSGWEASSAKEDATNSKKEKQNEYSSAFLKLQFELNEPDTSFIASSSSTPTASNKKSDNIIQNLIQPDCLKLVKLASAAESAKKLFRVKSSQNIKKNAIVAEYIGRVMLEHEHGPESSQPFVMFYKLEANDAGLPSSTSYAASSSSLGSSLDSRVCIDSSSIGNMTRYIRKSCSPNCTLKHVADHEGSIHFLVLALANIVKGAEISLPFEMDKAVLNKNTNIKNYVFCNCDGKSCSLKAKLNEEADAKARKESAAAKRNKREASSSDYSLDESKKQHQAAEKSKAKERNATVNKSDHENQPNSKKKPAQAAADTNSSRLVQSKPTEKVNLESSSSSSSKVLSREDRKLMSYMRVIEKLEMQGKRKKMLKEQKEISAASSSEPPKAEPNSTLASTQSPAEAETKNQTKNGLAKTKEKSKNLGLIHSRQSEPERSQLDNEIARIIENASEKQHDPSLAHPHSSSQSAEKLTPVKSPDFSFVDLTIQPRKTLNLLQRNLSSPCVSCEQPRALLESSTSLTDSCMAEADASSQTGSVGGGGDEQSFNQHIFNPKKYWLKCSSVGEANEQAPSRTQPLKKRRHMFEENSAASADVSLNPINELELSNNNNNNNNIEISDSFELEARANEDPTRASFESNQIFIPSLISNAFESYYNMNHCSPYHHHLTPSYSASSEMNPFFPYELNCQLTMAQAQLSGNELNDSSCSLVSVCKEEADHLNRESLELSQSELDAANAEAQKRKKVGFLELN